jgi:hypothetical protein
VFDKPSSMTRCCQVERYSFPFLPSCWMVCTPRCTVGMGTEFSEVPLGGLLFLASHVSTA